MYNLRKFFFPFIIPHPSECRRLISSKLCHIIGYKNKIESRALNMSKLQATVSLVIPPRHRVSADTTARRAAVCPAATARGPVAPRGPDSGVSGRGATRAAASAKAVGWRRAAAAAAGVACVCLSRPHQRIGTEQRAPNDARVSGSSPPPSPAGRRAGPGGQDEARKRRGDGDERSDGGLRAHVGAAAYRAPTLYISVGARAASVYRLSYAMPRLHCGMRPIRSHRLEISQ